MRKHQWFDLHLHTDDELSELLSAPITARETLHEWPLSCVQRVVTAQGQQWIYKTQTGPTIESAFHAQAQSNLLVKSRTIYQQAGHLIMLFEYVAAPLIQDLTLTDETVMQIGREVVAQIAAIKGNVPVLFDVSSPVKWRRMVQGTADRLTALVMGGQFTRVTATALATLHVRVLHDAILSATQRQCGLVHGDLTGDNLFILPDGGYKLIDWARPFRGPTDLDLAALLESLGYDPLEEVDGHILTMLYMLRINWLTDCATRWFPAGSTTYDQQIADLIAQIADL